MKLLAIDTSSLACSVALSHNDAVVKRHEEQAREHTRLLMPMIDAVLDDAGLVLADLDALVLGNGPGSFIGMRIGASVVQGLAFGAGLRVVPVSSLLAVAAQVAASTGANRIAVAQDAHVNEIYLGLYGMDGSGELVARAPERLHDQSLIDELEDAPGSYVAAGFGWERYPDLLGTNRDFLKDVVDVMHPSAEYLLAPAERLLDAGAAIDPSDVSPAYLRQTVARKPGDR